MYRIETQDVFFSGPASVEKYVEIGPANILGGMAKKTIASKYAASDRFHSLERRILSLADDMKEIYSIYPEEATTSPEPKATDKPTRQPSSSAGPKESVPAPPAAAPAAPAAPASSVAVDVPDVPVTPEHIIRSIVANKLKKSFEDVQVGTSIKDISSGESVPSQEEPRLLKQYRQVHTAK